MDKQESIQGIHHVAVIGSGIRQSIDFYSRFLGLKLIKQTVKMDEPQIYQLVFGDENGTPENTLSIFPYEELKQGRHGTGQVNTTTFSVPMDALDFWINRLEEFEIPHKHPQQRFEEEVFVYFEDKSGLGLELVFNDKDQRAGYVYGDIPQEKAIRGFYNVEIWEKNYARLAGLLTQQLNHRLILEKGNRIRFAVEDIPGKYIDVLSGSDAPKGFKGQGTVHRLAFTTPNVDILFTLRENLHKAGYSTSFIIDKKYYQSIYFEAASGVGLEIATLAPGFTVDEKENQLGEKLMLPLQFEWQRTEIEKNFKIKKE